MNSTLEQLAWIVATCIATVVVIPPIHAFGYWMQRHKNTIDNYAWIVVTLVLCVIAYWVEYIR